MKEILVKGRSRYGEGLVVMDVDVSRVLVAGGIDYTDRDAVFRVLDHLCPEQVIHGGAEGADSLSDEWADERGVWVTAFKADWGKLGRIGGPARNERMLFEAKPTLVVAFQGGPGTRDMVNRAVSRGIRTVVPVLVSEPLRYLCMGEPPEAR